MEYNGDMGWLRKGCVHFLSFLLLVGLLGGALATSAKLNLTHPDKVENWLSQSRLYGHFVKGIIEQSEKETIDNQSGSVSLNDAAVQKAAQSAFPPQLLEQNVNTFLESNYAWLEGKTATPEFKIDLTAAKQSFAEQVGQYVRVYTAGLPVCNASQLATLQTQQTDPLLATCRPPTLTPEVAGAEVSKELESSGDFLSNPVVTARTINPEATDQTQPYYEKLAHLPQVYQLAGKLPWIFGALALLSAISIVFIAPVKRAGLRRIAVLLASSGAVLILIKIVADFGFRRVEQKIFNTANNGQLQQSLTDFAHRVEIALVKTDLLFGIVFLIVALIICTLLFRTRRPDPLTKHLSLQQEAIPPSAPLKPQTPNIPETKPQDSRNPRPPRLIQ